MPHTHLLRDHVSLALIEELEQMLEGARHGLVVGAVMGVALKGRKFHVTVSGTLARDPTYARGICAALDDELMNMVHSRADAGTTL